MGVPGQQHFPVAFAQLLEGAEEGEHFLAHCFQLVAQEEFQVHEHLVVARASGVDFLAQFPVLTREQQFYLGVYVLHVVFEHEASFTDAERNFVQTLVQDFELLFAEQPYAAEHSDVGFGTLHVVCCELEVQHAVVAHGELVHNFCGCGAFIPECRHKKLL